MDAVPSLLDGAIVLIIYSSIYKDSILFELEDLTFRIEKIEGWILIFDEYGKYIMKSKMYTYLFFFFFYLEKFNNHKIENF